jgi:ABC-type nitrate/sulfonate/bicarbonate transport system substrate-binding protein
VKSKFIDEHPKEAERYITALRQAILFVAQNHTKSAEWFGEYLRTTPSVIEKVSKDDPFYNVTGLDQVDISVKASDRALIGGWAENAYAQGMIKQKVDLGSLFLN